MDGSVARRKADALLVAQSGRRCFRRPISQFLNPNNCLPHFQYFFSSFYDESFSPLVLCAAYLFEFDQLIHDDV